MMRSNTRRLLTGLLAVSTSLCGALGSPAHAQGGSNRSTEDQLVGAWAPFLAKEQIQDVRGRGDYLTSFDFDGSWRLDNNPANISAYDLVSVASTWWSRTEGYVLLGYTFYWPQSGYRNENVVRSAVVLVERPSAEAPRGRFVGLAVQHEDEWIFAGERDELDDPLPYRPAPRDLDDVDFARIGSGFHPVVYAKETTHELVAEVDPTENRRPALFEERRVVELDRFQTTMLGTGRGKSIYAGGKAGDFLAYPFGVFYAPAGEAGVPASANQRAPGRLAHHWEVFSYELRPIDPFWERRAASSEEEPVVDRYGRLVGSGDRGAGALPPWLSIVNRENSEGKRERRIEPSEMFFDGTRAFSRAFGIPEQPVLDSSLGSAAQLQRARAGLFSGVAPGA